MTVGVYTDRPLPVPPAWKAPEWATWIELRQPEFKLHAHLGHAKNAIKSSGHGLLYRWMDGQWTCVAIANKGAAEKHPLLRAKVVPTEPVMTYLIHETP